MKKVSLLFLLAASLAISGPQAMADTANDALPTETLPEDETQAINTNQTVAATNTTKTTPAPTLVASLKKNNMPHMELLSPVKRKDVDLTRLASKPCGGTKSGPVHYETTPGSRNLVAWRIIKEAPNGRCIIRVSDSPKEADMVVVKPTDGSAADDGSFPCGREVTSYEAKEIKIPRDLICDQCIIQLVWLTDEGDQYRCTDFESLATEVPECFGQCLNGGICKNGRCACPDGFSGSNCQSEDEPETGPSLLQVLLDDSVILIVYALMIALIIGLFIGAYLLYKRALATMQENQQVVVPDSADKLTSNQAGLPGAQSRFSRFD